MDGNIILKTVWATEDVRYLKIVIDFYITLITFKNC